MIETAPATEWIAAGYRSFASAIEGLWTGKITDLPTELTGY